MSSADPAQGGTRRPRALLAYEFGAGRTHVSHILGVARRLRAAGVECLASLYDLRSAPDFAAIGIPAVQSYLWPGRRRFAPHAAERADRGLVDLLANLGFADGDAVAGALAHYDGLFTLFAPDIVLTENAFGALLASRGRVPAVAFGFNQLLPPPVAGSFPTFDGSPPSWSDAEFLAGVNEGFRRHGRPPLATPSDLLAIDAVLPFGPGTFDLYRDLRSAPVLPVHVGGYASGLRAGEGDEVFVYLQRDAAGLPAVLAALLALRRPTRAFLPDAGAEQKALLAGAGILVEERAVPIELILERSRCVLHHGGVGLSCALLAAGMPQVILAKELDNQAPGRLLAEEGLGRHSWLWDATMPWIVQATRAAYDDEEMRARCRARAPSFDDWFGADPAEHVAGTALRLLGIPRPSMEAP